MQIRRRAELAHMGVGPMCPYKVVDRAYGTWGGALIPI